MKLFGNVDGQAYLSQPMQVAFPRSVGHHLPFIALIRSQTKFTELLCRFGSTGPDRDKAILYLPIIIMIVILIVFWSIVKI
jgi:hypothetical protein